MRSFLVLLLTYSLSQFYRSFLAIVSPDLTRDLGLGPAELGVVSAVWFVAFAIMQFPAGIGLDRFGPRLTLGLMTLTAVLGALWLARASSYWECVAAMGLIGTGCAPALMAAMYVFGQEQGERDRFAVLSSAIIGLGTLGNIAATTPLARAVSAFGWRSSLVAIAGTTLLCAALVLIALKDPPRRHARESWSDVLGGVAKVARLRALWPILPLIGVSYAVVIAIRSLWIAPFLHDVHRLDIARSGDIALGMAVAMVLGALAFGPIDMRVGHKRAALIAAAGTVAGFVILGILGGATLWVAAASLAGIGFFGMSYAVLMAHGRDFIPPHLLGRGVTFLNFVFIAGAGVIQIVSGLFVRAAERQGWAPETTYGAFHLFFALLLGGAALLYWARAGERRAVASFSPPPPEPAR